MIELIGGNCGHLVPADMAPNARMHGQEVRICEDCLERVKRHGPRIETKAVQPAVETVLEPVAEKVVVVAKEDGPPYHDRRSTVPAYELGQMAAREGKTEDPPYLDRRTKEAKEWLRGYREAKSGGETKSDPG